MMIATSLLACKKDACPAARKTASADVVEAIEEANLERDKLQRKAEEAKSRASQLAESEKGFFDDLELFEQSMGCLQHADCCARLGKMSYPDRAGVWRSGKTLTQVRVQETRKLPADLEVVLQKYSNLIDQDGMGLNNPDPGVVMTWCTSIRDEIVKIRKDAPPIWKRAADDANEHAAEVDAMVAAHPAANQDARRLGGRAEGVEDAHDPGRPRQWDFLIRARSRIRQALPECVPLIAGILGMDFLRAAGAVIDPGSGDPRINPGAGTAEIPYPAASSRSCPRLASAVRVRHALAGSACG